MTNYVVTIIALIFIWESPRTIIRQYLDWPDNECMGIEEIDQNFFSDLHFYVVGGCLTDLPPTKPFEPITLAIDSAGQVFSVFGQDSSTCDQFVQEHPLELTASEVDDYGWFIVGITRTGRWGPYYRVTSTDSFLSISRTFYDFRCMQPSEEDWDTVRTRITHFIDTLSFGEIRFDSVANRYAADYYIWYEFLGQLVQTRLSISSNGHWEVISDSLVAQKVGYWTKLLY